MPSIIIAACPAHGHVTPLLTVARGYVERGDDVRFITGTKFTDRVSATGATHIALPPEADIDFDNLEAMFPERAKLKGLKAAAFDVEHVFAKPAKLQYEAIMAAHTAQPADVVLAEQNFVGSAFLLAHQRPTRPAVVVSVSTTPEDPDAPLRAWLRAYAKDHPRRGFRPAYHDARGEGWMVNHKKIQRLWREEGLRVPQRRRRKRHGTSTAPPAVSADAPNRVWAVDFQFDSTTDGRPIKIVSIVDEHTRECLGGMVERGVTGEHLIGELGSLAAERGTFPAVLRCDNGPELACSAMADWASGQVGLHFIPPGEPWRNGYVESFNSRIRDECLNINSFWSLAQARVVISDWKHQYNHHRRHSALGYRTPAEYAAACRHTHTPAPASSTALQ